MLDIIKTIEGECALFVVSGWLDTLSAPKLAAALDESLEGITSLTLDLEKLEYISSAGLRVLLVAQKTMNEQGEMKVIHVSPTIRDTFEITGFVGILTIE